MDMRYRRLGTAGVRFSEIGLGGWLTYGHGVEAERSREIMRRAFELGINFFDTADIYHLGGSETVFGQVLKEFRRQDLCIATKLFWPMSDNVNDRGLSRKHVFESIHNSLERLQTDYVDLYQCHRFDPDTPVFELVRAMDDLIRQGKILYWGVSEWPALEIKNACAIAREIHACPPVSNQPEYSIASRRVETNGVQTACTQEGLGMVVWSPLKQGVLTGKYSGGTTPKDSRAADDKMNRFINDMLGRTPDLPDKVDRLRPIAEKHGRSLAQLALAWVLTRAAVSSAIVGATRVAQLEENCAALTLELDADDLATIDELFPPEQYP